MKLSSGKYSAVDPSRVTAKGKPPFKKKSQGKLKLTWLACLAVSGSLAEQALSGPAMAPSLSPQNEKASISYDTYGVPYIFGTTDRAAYYGAGYAAARDRLFQMHFVRLEMRGQLAEWFGKDASALQASGTPFTGSAQWLKSDKRTRKLGYRRYAQEVAAALSSAASGTPEAQAHEFLSAYADGVNAYISQIDTPDPNFPDKMTDAGSGFSPMFAKFGITSADMDADPWTVEDCVLAWMEVAIKFESGLGADHQRAKKVQGLSLPAMNTQALQLLFPYRQIADHSATIQPGDMDVTIANAYALGRGVNQFNRAEAIYMPTFSEAAAVRGSSLLSDEEEEESGEIGSVLWGGPRIQVGLPNIVHEFYFAGPGFSARGAAFPGNPTFLVGQNAQPLDWPKKNGDFVPVAWTVASQRNDIIDLYVIDLVHQPSGDPHYFFGGQPKAFEVYETEDIQVLDLSAGTYTTENVIYAETRWGPIVTALSTTGDVELVGAPSAGQHYAAAISTIWRSAPSPTSLDTSIAGIAMNRSSGLAELVTAITEHYRVPCTSMVVADAAGEIGYTATGDVPVRKNGDQWAGILPMDGNDPSSRWQTFVPPIIRPQTINPVRDYVYTANQLPIDSSYDLLPYYEGAGDNLRSYRLRCLLEENAAAGTLSDALVEGLSRDVTRQSSLDVTRLAELARTQGWFTFSAPVLALLSDLTAWHPELGGGTGQLDGSDFGSVLAGYLNVFVRNDNGINCGTVNPNTLVPFVSCPDAVVSSAEAGVRTQYGTGVSGALNMLAEMKRFAALPNADVLAPDFLEEFEMLGNWIEWAYCETQVQLSINPVPGSNFVPCDPINWVPNSVLQTRYLDLRLSKNSVRPLGLQRSPGFRAVGYQTAWFRQGFATPLESAAPQNRQFPVDPISSHVNSLADIHNVAFNQYCRLGMGLDDSETLLGGGQSEKPSSPHYGDQMQLQASGQAKSAPTTVDKIRGVVNLPGSINSYTLVVP